MPGVVEDGLVILLHRRELLSAYIGSVVHPLLGEREAAVYRLAQILDVEELLALLAGPDHGEVVPGKGTVVEEREDPEPLGTHERLRPDNGHYHAPGAVLEADHLGLDLGLPVWPHALQPVRLVQRMMIRYPVHRRRRDVRNPFHTMPPGRLQDIARPLYVRRVDLLRRVEWQSGRGVHHEVHALHRPVHDDLIADITLDDLDPTPLRVVELLDVQRSERI